MQEKKKLYNPNDFNAADSAIAFIIVLAVFVALGLFVTPLLREMYRGGADYYLVLIISTVMSQGAILLVGLSYSKARNVNPIVGGGYEIKLSLVDILMGIILVFGVYGVFSSLHMDFNDYVFGTGTQSPQTLPEGNQTYMLIYALVCVPFLPAICEETLFRGVIMRGLRQYGFGVTVILSGLMFSLMHGSLEQIILQFVGGMAIGAAVYLTKNFLVGMCMHASYNLFTAVSSALIYAFKENSPSFYVAQIFTVIIGSCCLIVGIYYFAKMGLKRYKDKLNNTTPKAERSNAVYALANENDIDSIEYFPVSQKIELPDKGENKRVFLSRNGEKFLPINTKADNRVAIALLVVGIAFALEEIIRDYILYIL